LEIEKGTCTALVGESGSGKTTLGRAIAGRHPSTTTTEGTINILGRSAYMLQDAASALNPLRRVEWQLKQALTLRNTPRSEVRRRSLELLTDVGVPEPEVIMRRYPHELSGGLAQRVLLASVLATEPDVLVADEPTSALDVTTQARVMKLFRRIVKERGLTLVLITHDIVAASLLSDRVAVILEGHIVEENDTASVIQSPSHAYTRALVAAATSTEVTTAGGAINESA